MAHSYIYDGISRGIGDVANIMNIYHGIRDRQDKRIEREEEKAYRAARDARTDYNNDRDYELRVRQQDATEKHWQQQLAIQRQNSALMYAQHNFNVRKYNDEQAQREYERQVMRDIYTGNGFSQEEADFLDNNYGSDANGVTFNPSTNYIIGSEYGDGTPGKTYGYYSGNDANGNPVAVPIAMSRGDDGRPNIREIGEAMPLAEAQQKFADTGAKLEQEGQAAMAEQQQQPKSLSAGINPMQIKRTLTDKDIKAKQTEIRMDKIANKIPLTAEEQSIMSLNPDDFKKPANPAVAELKAKQTEIRMNKIANDIPLTEAEQAIMSQNPDVIGRPVQPAADAQEPTQSEPQPSKDAGAFQRLSSPDINTAKHYNLGANVKSMGKVKTPTLSDEQANDRINKLAMIATSQYASSEDKKMAREALEAIRYFGKNKSQSIPDMIDAYKDISARNKAIRDEEIEVAANHYGERLKDQYKLSSDATTKEWDDFGKGLKDAFKQSKGSKISNQTVDMAVEKTKQFIGLSVGRSNKVLNNDSFKIAARQLTGVLIEHPEWDAVTAYAFAQKHGNNYKGTEDDAKIVSDAISQGYALLENAGVTNPKDVARISTEAAIIVNESYDKDFTKYQQVLTEMINNAGGR